MSTSKDISREELLSKPPIERIPYIHNIYIKYTKGEKILQNMEGCYKYCLEGADQPVGMCLFGPSGAGKTTLLNDFSSRYPPIKKKLKTIFPVLNISIEAPARMGSFVTTILNAFGDPLADRGTIASRSNRISKFIDGCEVKMIIFDEIQHLVDPDKKKLLNDVTDFLKTKIKAHSIACVFSGLKGSSEPILTINEQLGRLFPDPLYLEPFSLKHQEKDTITEFRNFLHSINETLPLRESSGLDEYATAKKIHKATGGKIGYIMELIRHATRLALDLETEKLDDDILHRAFMKRLAPRRRKIESPFIEQQ